MTKIFIEAKNKNTAEYHFIKAILNIFSRKEMLILYSWTVLETYLRKPLSIR